MEISGFRDGVARTAVALAGVLGIGSLVLTIVLMPDFSSLTRAAIAAVFLPVPLVGAAAVRARTGGAVGWILLAAGVSLPLATGAYVYAAQAPARGLPGGTWAGWLDGWPWIPGVMLVPTVAVLLFPDGKLPSGRWRPVLWLDLAVSAALVVWTVFGTELIDFPGRANPTGLPGAAGEIADGFLAAIILVAPCSTLSAIAITRRYRTQKATTAGRALGLVVPAAWAAAVSWWSCILVSAVYDKSIYVAPLESAGMLAIAIACWVGIRRYGLLDVRAVFGQTAVYTLLTAAVLVVYFAVAGAAGIVAKNLAGPFAVAVAVLVALPAREFLQRRVNRLVYGYGDDPRAAMDRLGQRLADAADSGHVLQSVADVVRDTLRLAYVGIDLAAERVAEAGPRPARTLESLELPLDFAGERIGRIEAVAGPDRIITTAERRLLGDIARQVASVAHAVSLTEQLSASRERLVAAGAEERRRLRRDLHDGLGPALAGVVLGLHRARTKVTDDPDTSRLLLDQLSGQVQVAVADVRRLVYGLRPPALDELGLVAAIDEQGRALGGVTVHGDLDGDLPAAVEVAAYRIALEAMTNAARHSGSSSCQVHLELNGALHVRVEDDGSGMPQSYRAGVGIASMRERATELGGSCRIEARTPTGTVVHAILPVDAVR